VRQSRPRPIPEGARPSGSLTQSAQIAAVAVVVDAVDANAIRFYKHFDFMPFPERPNRLFLPMETIAALFG